MSPFVPNRRRLLRSGGLFGIGLAGAALSACHHGADEAGGEVTANEDLMREHGGIRRALFVYADAARRARQAPATLPFSALLDTARLFRSFAEDYHERALEEAHIFPAVRKLQSPAAQLPDILQTQHQRCREITDYILRIAAGSSLAPAEAERFAGTLESLIAMYGPHAAREDTVLFPAWKAALGEKGYDEAGDQFEDIERKTFGHDGYADAVARIGRIETDFGLGDLSKLTPQGVA